MKTFLRTIAILAAALAVVGLTIAFSNTTFGHALRMRGAGGEESGRERVEQSHQGDVTAQGFPPRNGQRPERSGERESYSPHLGGITEVVKSLIKITAVVVLVVLGGWTLGWGRRNLPRPPKAEPGSPPPA